MFHSAVSHQDVLYMLQYVPATGNLIWKNPRGRVAKGSIAGTTIKGVRYLRLASYLMKASDVAYFWMRGEWMPTRCKDGDATNLEWTNIEVVPETKTTVDAEKPYTYLHMGDDGEWCISGNMGLGLLHIPAALSQDGLKWVQAVFLDGEWHVNSLGIPEQFVSTLKTKLEGV